MNLRRTLDRVLLNDRFNFVVTNRVPRRLLTRLAGWFCRIEQPIVRDASIALWTLCAGDLQLEDAKQAQFASLHDCFIRELKPGARPVDRAPGVLVSPCDAIVGAFGAIQDGALVQVKGSSYRLETLLGDTRLAARYRNGTFVTLRLTASMYHRFHAPADCEVIEVRYIAGDFWNVNPIALRRVPQLYCRNERVVIQTELFGSSEGLMLVPVAAILVGGIRLNFLELPLDSRYRGPSRIACGAAFQKGDELGYFQHGSTILVLTTPGLVCTPNVRDGARIRFGEPLLTSTGPQTL